MKAYELFLQDLKGDELVRVNTDRRVYYNTLRQTLRTELMAGARSELLEHYARRLEADAPRYMYLLDAAALWECYEAALEGPRRFPRDIGQGLPFPMDNGRRLTWMNVQHQSDMGTLPVAVVDDALRTRLCALVTYMNTPEAERASLQPPAVDARARLAMADAHMAEKIPAPGAEAASAAPAPTPELAQLQAALKEQQAKIDRLEAERSSMQSDLEQLRREPRQGNEELVRLMEMILHNQMAESAALANRLGGEVNESVQRAQELQQTVKQLQAQLDDAQEQYRADLARAEALRAQRQAEEQRAAEARQACAQAQEDAAAAQQAKQAAEKALSEAHETLSQENARLRELQARMARVNGAAALTRRQADRLS